MTTLLHGELRVLTLLAQGYEPKRIARALGIKHQTVRRHAANIYKKLGVNSSIQAALWAWRNGVVSVDEAWETVKAMEWGQ